MGRMTLENFREELLLGLRNRTDVSTSLLDRWINQAYLHTCRPEVKRHKELRVTHEITLVASQSNYPMDDTTVGHEIIAPYDVVYYAGTTADNSVRRQDVRPRSLSWFHRTQLVEAAGGPQHYLWDEDQIVFSPIPTSTENGHKVLVHHWREPAALVQLSDVTIIGAYWDRAIVLGSRYFAQDSLGLGEPAIATMQKYALYLNETTDEGELQFEDTDFKMEFERERYQ